MYFDKLSNSSKLLLKYFIFNTFFFAILFWLTPMSSDDVNFWTLRLTNFQDILAFSLPYGNGRLLGNIGVLYLVEYKVLRVVVKALVMAGLAVLLPLILGLKDKISFSMSGILILAVSPHIFAQCYSWTSGFQNYVPPIFLFLLGLVLIQQYSSFKSLPARLLSFVILFVCGLFMQLYVEHSSLLNLLFLFCLMVYEAVKKRRISPALVSFFVGAFIGIVVMFLIPKTFYTGGSTYRATAFSSGLAGMVVSVVKNTIKLLGMYSENTLALSLLSGLQVFLVAKKRAAFKKFYLLLIASLSVPTLFLVCYHKIGFKFWYGKLAVYESLLLSAALLTLFVAVIISAAVLLKENKSCSLIFAYTMLVFSVISIVPLAFVEPIWPRCILHAYLFLVAAILLLLKSALSYTELSSFRNMMARVLPILLAVIMICFIALFADLNRMYNIRETTIAQWFDEGRNSIDYFDLPSDYIYDFWQQHYYEAHYSFVHGKDAEINNIPAEVWFNKYYYMTDVT